MYSNYLAYFHFNPQYLTTERPELGHIFVMLDKTVYVQGNKFTQGPEVSTVTMIVTTESLTC